MEEQSKKTLPFVKNPKLYITIFAPFIVILLAFFIFRNQIIIASVNGQAITRFTLISQLEKQGGKQVLDSLITETLILQEAKKQNVQITPEEIEQEIATIEQRFTGQGQSFEEILTSQGMTRQTLASQIEVQMLVEKLSSKDVEVTDQEIDDYVTQNEMEIPEGSEGAQLRSQIGESLKQEKSQGEVQVWLDALKANANIKYNMSL
jgi:foldase protein PrsA